MKISIIFALSVVGLVGTASGAPLCVSGGSLFSYEQLGMGGCTIGDKLFSNFIYGGTGGGTGVAVLDTAVFLTPVNAGSSPGLIFSSAGWVVPSVSPTDDSFVDSSIQFTVTVVGGAALIEDAGMILSSSSATGTGFGDITETLTDLGLQLQVDTALPLSSHVFFAPRNSVNVLKDLLVAVPQGTDPGFAQITSFEEDFSQVPEPVGSALVGSGLLALGFLRRRSMRRS